MGVSVNVKWHGIYTFGIRDKTYEVEFSAKGTNWHQPAVFYYKDGSGSPEEDEDDVNEVTIESVIYNGVDIVNDISDEMIEKLKEDITDKIYDGEYEPEYPDEPNDYNDDFDNC